MQKLILILLFNIGVFFSMASAEEFDDREYPPMQYGLSGQYIPVQCGLTTDVNIYIQAKGFQPQTFSAGRAGAKPDGEPAYFVTVFYNESFTEQLIVVTSPNGDESCIVSHSFDLTLKKQAL